MSEIRTRIYYLEENSFYIRLSVFELYYYFLYDYLYRLMYESNEHTGRGSNPYLVLTWTCYEPVTPHIQNVFPQH